MPPAWFNVSTVFLCSASACAGPLCCCLQSAATVQHLMWSGGGFEGEYCWASAKLTERKDRQAGSVAATQGESRVVRQRNHPQNNLHQNSFCQQVLRRESPFRLKNLLMHFRAHIALSPRPTNKHCAQRFAASSHGLSPLFLCLDLFSYIESNPSFPMNGHSSLKHFLPHGYKNTHMVFGFYIFPNVRHLWKMHLKTTRGKKKMRRREKQREVFAQSTSHDCT